ncbi:MAG: immunity 26/phosphotriesterase HocA family protein [Pseudomonadales bacterium]|nr:immunity 26/phosphotriesterase HocA family protein [Pseudomonadales bacterium]NRA18220.1 hypothetical protein [Oceanospirillaceae bacterium]
MVKVKSGIGDIVMIPIGGCLFVFGRLLRDASIAIYSFVSNEPVDVRQLAGENVLFDAGVFGTNIANGQWQIIGNIPFSDDDESWSSPQYIRDIINPSKYRIYYKGEMKPANEEDVSGLEKQVMYKPEGLVEEIKIRLVIQ